MSIKQSMRDIDRAVADATDDRDEYEADEQGRSPREAYERSIEAVSEVAGKTSAERLAAWVETTIRDEGRLPSSEAVREKGGEICRDEGRSVERNDWLRA